MIDLAKLESIRKQVDSALNGEQPITQVLLQVEEELAAMIQDELDLTTMIRNYALEEGRNDVI
ncbi:MAG: hypothetical protein WC073_01865 [Sterolibacterium sp.]